MIHDPIDQGQTLATRTRVALGALAASVVLALAACGGAKDEQNSGTVSEIPASRSDAARFLTQASFGPTTAAVDRVMAIGYGAWIDEQLAAPQASHRASWEAQDAVVKAANAANSIGQDGIYNSFWKQAISGEDQLRQRVAFALSQIFVISLQDSTVGDNPRAVADYMDMLATRGFGNYRDLLESVSLHPMMGAYLTSLRNRKADPRTGRVPDENYAREVMQLFSIGLQQLNDDGSFYFTDTATTEIYTGVARKFSTKTFRRSSMKLAHLTIVALLAMFASAPISAQQAPAPAAAPPAPIPGPTLAQALKAKAAA